jgi:septal ring factor EnvC (AmiA/AmiB activator)
VPSTTEHLTVTIRHLTDCLAHLDQQATDACSQAKRSAAALKVSADRYETLERQNDGQAIMLAGREARIDELERQHHALTNDLAEVEQQRKTAVAGIELARAEIERLTAEAAVLRAAAAPQGVPKDPDVYASKGLTATQLGTLAAGVTVISPYLRGEWNVLGVTGILAGPEAVTIEAAGGPQPAPKLYVPVESMRFDTARF